MLNVNSLKTLSACLRPPLLKSLSAGSSTRIVYPSVFQSASITSKHFRDRTIKKPAPWPYKEKKFSLLRAWLYLDNTRSRFDENTQLIVVEGNIGCGKSEFAKKLADEFEMLHFPEPSVDSLYINEYGFDLKLLDDIVPESYKSYTLKDYYKNPNDKKAYCFQMLMYYLRLEQYFEALAHLLNTGQGVVLERCVFSDYVFVETMRKMGFLTDGMKSVYNDTRTHGLWDLDLKPTLVIYLDADVDTLMDRIKKRNIDYEVNSKALTKDYLSTLEHYYKQDYLKYISKHSELLIYDWSKFGDVEEVAHDIEKLQFEQYDKYDYKLKYWREDDKEQWDYYRFEYTNYRDRALYKTQVPRFDVPEILIPGEDAQRMADIINKLPDYQYEKGFNPFMGKEGLKKPTYWEEQKFRLYKDMFTLVYWND